VKYLKFWWNEECKRELERYQVSRQVEDWKNHRNVIKKSKYKFFDTKIQKIVGKNHGPWELMNWVKKYKLLAIEAI